MKHLVLFNFCFLLLVFLPSIAAPLENIARDPTKPVPTSTQVNREKSNVSFNLQSIIINPNQRRALINNRLVKVDDTIEGAKVIAIQRNAVVLSEAGKKLVIYLFKRGIWN